MIWKSKNELGREKNGLAQKKGRCLEAAAQFVCALIGFLANLLSSALSRQGLLYPALRTWLQVERVALHFFDDVFRLNLPLEATEGVVD
jgi:hypothetical protein